MVLLTSKPDAKPSSAVCSCEARVTVYMLDRTPTESAVLPLTADPGRSSTSPIGPFARQGDPTVVMTATRQTAGSLPAAWLLCTGDRSVSPEILQCP